ncbi:hypothetical protein NMY22_g19204 [Coprinellus aureogranulatus]|nr:hypothetical protein NMY22_g19204 [Coprinellus aureogranulatus]
MISCGGAASESALLVREEHLLSVPSLCFRTTRPSADFYLSDVNLQAIYPNNSALEFGQLLSHYLALGLPFKALHDKRPNSSPKVMTTPGYTLWTRSLGRSFVAPRALPTHSTSFKLAGTKVRRRKIDDCPLKPNAEKTCLLAPIKPSAFLSLRYTTILTSYYHFPFHKAYLKFSSTTMRDRAPSSHPRTTKCKPSTSTTHHPSSNLTPTPPTLPSLPLPDPLAELNQAHLDLYKTLNPSEDHTFPFAPTIQFMQTGHTETCTSSTPHIYHPDGTVCDKRNYVPGVGAAYPSVDPVWHYCPGPGVCEHVSHWDVERLYACANSAQENGHGGGRNMG